MTVQDQTSRRRARRAAHRRRPPSKVKSLLEQEGRDDLALRVAVQPGGCRGLRYQLFFDERSLDGDVITDFGGVGVVVDRMSAPYLARRDDRLRRHHREAGLHHRQPQRRRLVRLRRLVPLSPATGRAARARARDHAGRRRSAVVTGAAPQVLRPQAYARRAEQDCAGLGVDHLPGAERLVQRHASLVHLRQLEARLVRVDAVSRPARAETRRRSRLATTRVGEARGHAAGERHDELPVPVGRHRREARLPGRRRCRATSGPRPAVGGAAPMPPDPRPIRAARPAAARAAAAGRPSAARRLRDSAGSTATCTSGSSEPRTPNSQDGTSTRRSPACCSDSPSRAPVTVTGPPHVSGSMPGRQRLGAGDQRHRAAACARRPVPGLAVPETTGYAEPPPVRRPASRPPCVDRARRATDQVACALAARPCGSAVDRRAPPAASTRSAGPRPRPTVGDAPGRPGGRRRQLRRCPAPGPPYRSAARAGVLPGPARPASTRSSAGHGRSSTVARRRSDRSGRRRPARAYCHGPPGAVLHAAARRFPPCHVVAPAARPGARGSPSAAAEPPLAVGPRRCGQPRDGAASGAGRQVPASRKLRVAGCRPAGGASRSAAGGGAGASPPRARAAVERPAPVEPRPRSDDASRRRARQDERGDAGAVRAGVRSAVSCRIRRGCGRPVPPRSAGQSP